MAAEHHFDNVHRFAVGNAHSLHKFPLFADFAQHIVNLRAAAVNHHGIDADQFQQGDVFGETFFQTRLGHGVAAVFDDDGAAGEAADVGQGFGEDFGFGCGGEVFGLIHNFGLFCMAA